MEWLSSTFTKIQEEIQTQREEFLAEQARFCDADARQNLKTVVDMLNPLADESGSAEAAAEEVAADALPWERPGMPEERVARMKQLSMDHMAFLTLPPEDTDFTFDLKAAMPVVLRLLQQDQQIERWRFLLVPKRVSEEQFFRNYFYQLAVIAGDVSGPADSPLGAHAPGAAELVAHAAREQGQRSTTPSADSVGGSVVSVVAPSAESEQFELISNELLDGAYRSQLSECADSLTRPAATASEGSGGAAPVRASVPPADATPPPATAAAGRAPAPPAEFAPPAANNAVDGGLGGSAGAAVGAGTAGRATGEPEDAVDSWEQELQAELAQIESKSAM